MKTDNIVEIYTHLNFFFCFYIVYIDTTTRLLQYTVFGTQSHRMLAIMSFQIFACGHFLWGDLCFIIFIE